MQKTKVTTSPGLLSLTRADPLLDFDAIAANPADRVFTADSRFLARIRTLTPMAPIGLEEIRTQRPPRL